MTLREATQAYNQQRFLVIRELRKPYATSESDAERTFFPRRPKAPSGPLRWFFFRDFERVLTDWNRCKARLMNAKARLLEFDADVANGESHMQRKIRVLTQQRCDLVDERILKTLVREQRRRAEVDSLAEAVSTYCDDTGESHELLLPGASRMKWCGVLIGAIELAGRKFAKATADRGFSYVLFPWKSDMESSVGRPLWLWYDARNCPCFAPIIAARPSLPSSARHARIEAE